MKFKIQKNVPMIKIYESKRRKQNKYPFKIMGVGDSFCYGKYSREEMTKISNAARIWAKEVGSSFKFSCRKTEDNKIRIWRVE